ncbi:hypothetical protein LCGC14_0831550 [marine sediment metagenome]|uniref:NTP pyrophosphohydrolase MazG putative catalytic core domain-containing protein n=1 Tax=marine sediment metagenome TaxID=412755 RepID=A0A0F9S0K3_9ZZZZ|nr:hypothetical protein [bacterium]
MRDPKNKIRLYHKALEKWGQDAQILKTVEELCELVLALLGTDQGKIHEEMADVEIMLEQLEVTLGCRNMVKIQKLAKLERLKGWINETD